MRAKSFKIRTTKPCAVIHMLGRGWGTGAGYVRQTRRLLAKYTSPKAGLRLFRDLK